MPAQLAGALVQLSEADRDVLLLTSWAGLDSNEVADALGIPVGTVPVATASGAQVVARQRFEVRAG